MIIRAAELEKTFMLAPITSALMKGYVDMRRTMPIRKAKITNIAARSHCICGEVNETSSVLVWRERKRRDIQKIVHPSISVVRNVATMFVAWASPKISWSSSAPMVPRR